MRIIAATGKSTPINFSSGAFSFPAATIDPNIRQNYDAKTKHNTNTTEKQDFNCFACFVSVVRVVIYQSGPSNRLFCSNLRKCLTRKDDNHYFITCNSVPASIASAIFQVRKANPLRATKFVRT